MNINDENTMLFRKQLVQIAITLAILLCRVIVNGKDYFLKYSLWKQSCRSLLKEGLSCPCCVPCRGCEGFPMIKSCLFNDLQPLTDPRVSRLCAMILPALLILLVSLALMLLPLQMTLTTSPSCYGLLSTPLPDIWTQDVSFWQNNDINPFSLY